MTNEPTAPAIVDPIRETLAAMIRAAETLLANAHDRDETHDEDTGEYFEDWEALEISMDAAKALLAGDLGPIDDDEEPRCPECGGAIHTEAGGCDCRQGPPPIAYSWDARERFYDTIMQMSATSNSSGHCVRIRFKDGRVGDYHIEDISDDGDEITVWAHDGEPSAGDLTTIPIDDITTIPIDEIASIYVY